MIVPASVSLATAIPLIVLAVTTVSGVLAWWANGIRAERARLQQLYADAYAAVVSYQEFPFVIRRRRAPLPGQELVGNDERIRIADALQAVQEQLSNYIAQIRTESTEVSVRYDALVHQTRLIAGGYMHNAWEGPPLDNDAGMNISDIDYSELDAPRADYLAAMKNDLRFLRVAFTRSRALLVTSSRPFSRASSRLLPAQSVRLIAAPERAPRWATTSANPGARTAGSFHAGESNASPARRKTGDEVAVGLVSAPDLYPISRVVFMCAFGGSR